MLHKIFNASFHNIMLTGIFLRMRNWNNKLGNDTEKDLFLMKWIFYTSLHVIFLPSIFQLCVKFISNGESDSSKITALCSSDTSRMADEIGII